MYIDLKDISYIYEDRKQVFKDFSFAVEKGESVALMGVNGCGKTTLLRILCGLNYVQTGNYYFKDQDISKDFLAKPEERKKFHQQVGYVFQHSEDQLFCPTVYEEVAFGLEQMNLSPQAIETRVTDVLELLQISKIRDAVPYHCSGGEKKRIAIAAVLAMNPEVILLDEPLAALDPRMQTFFVHLLQQLKENGKTIIIATHDIQRVQHMVDRICLFDENHQLVADGRVKDILMQVDLLKKINLVDDSYHVHEHEGEVHYHL